MNIFAAALLALGSPAAASDLVPAATAAGFSERMAPLVGEWRGEG